MFNRIKKIFPIKTPFFLEELTDDFIQEAIKDSLILINKHRPKVISSNKPLNNPKYTLIRHYPSEYDFEKVLVFDRERDLAVGGFSNYVYLTEWNEYSIMEDTSTLESRTFESLVLNYCSVFVGNDRRKSVGMMSVDLDGERFRDEAIQDINKITTFLENSTQNTL